ncbi:Uncharacterised protein [Chlamydia trachomatis]|nr:Uncharacterised protein [Chlamydia trachomatis]
MRKKADSKGKEVKNVAMERSRGLYILALQRVLQAPEELRSTLQDLNINLQQYMTKHCVRESQAQATWLSLLSFLDMITALSLVDAPNDTNIDDEINQIQFSGFSLEDLQNLEDLILATTPDFELEQAIRCLDNKKRELLNAKREYKYQAFVLNEIFKDYIAKHKESVKEAK